MPYNDLDCTDNILHQSHFPRIQSLSKEELINIYSTGTYEIYFIEYSGDIVSALLKVDYAGVYITDKFFAVLIVKKGMLNTLVDMVPEITNIQPNALYSLSELIVSDYTNNHMTEYENDIPLNGEGVIVGIIGTGIDYLNPRFKTEKEESKIVAIWDQTIDIGQYPSFFPYGTEYSNEELTNAIKAKASGKSPYEVVAHRDDMGHGTAIAGIIGGRNLGGDDKFRSAAPECDFAIVKLREAQRSTLEFAKIDTNIKNVYETINIAAAITYLSDLQEKLKKPMVIYLPLGTNFGGREGNTILERYIDNLSQKNTFSIVTNTGNQGDGRTHTSGVIKGNGDLQEAYINIDPMQESLNIGIYTRKSDRISITITDPSGKAINRIPMITTKDLNKFLTHDENNINLEYLANEASTGANSLNILIKNATTGIWKIGLYGERVVNGLYDIWIPQSDLLKGDTRFLNPDPNTTLLTPCSAMSVLSTSYYNQIDNSVIESSGRGFPRNGKVEPVVTNGGVNLVTTGLYNKLILATGGAIAGGILAGAVALIYQWGIKEGKLPQLYTSRLKSLLISAVTRDSKIYPNEMWGFGKLDFRTLYDVLKRISNEREVLESCTNKNVDNCLYINIPSEIYEKLRKHYFF